MTKKPLSIFIFILSLIIIGLAGSLYFSGDTYGGYTPSDNAVITDDHLPGKTSLSGSDQKPKPTGTKIQPKLPNAENTTQASKRLILQAVPFSSQAPFAEWSDPRQQDGCEEISAVMAMYWAKGGELTADKAKQAILDISAYEAENWKSYHDTSASDTVSRIFQGYFNYDLAEARYDIDASDIIAELEKGNIVIVPLNGQALKNPHYTRGGPERHMLLVKGYDRESDEFITNDPGTRFGENYRYSSERLAGAIRDYPSGDRVPIKEKRRAMIVVSK